MEVVRGLGEGPYRGQKIEKVIPPEFCVAHDPGDESQDEDDAGEDDEKDHGRHPRVVTSREYAAIGIGEFERGYSCQCVRDDIHARVTVNSERDKKGDLLSCSRAVHDSRTHCLAWLWRTSSAQIQGVSVGEQVELRTARMTQLACENEHISNPDIGSIGPRLVLADTNTTLRDAFKLT